MKQLCLLGISLVAISACAPQSAPPPAASASPAQQVGAPAGSLTNTSRAFDGAYDGSFVLNMSAGSTTLDCPNYRVAPALTIRNGLAQLPVNNGRVNSTFQGYVSPDGTLAMQSEIGQAFQGQIDSNYVLRGRTVGNCVYDAAWKRTRSSTSHF